MKTKKRVSKKVKVINLIKNNSTPDAERARQNTEVIKAGLKVLETYKKTQPLGLYSQAYENRYRGYVEAIEDMFLEGYIDFNNAMKLLNYKNKKLDMLLDAVYYG